ncbi:hypothetical protein [Rathayibacter sp. AY1A3]|uniref:hypothetical protein n=1 Tax=Rathayibacter sp. AY1A3 TaxID=2080521 RepID=UPI0011B0C8D7|nr:hypothetical protein [Rathayibacter sp. AY1A3]
MKPPSGPSKNPGSAAPSNEDERVHMYEDAYSEGKRTVDDQVAELESMRQRSVTFVAFVGSATAFLVGTSLAAASSTDRDAAFFIWSWIATATSGATIFALVGVLLAVTFKKSWPFFRKERWNFRNTAKVLVDDWIDPASLSEKSYYRNLAITYSNKADENSAPLRRVRGVYTTLLVAGALQLACWSAVVWIYG